MNIDSIIFDLDGTLWSAIDGVCKCWTQQVAKHEDAKREITHEDMAGCMGLQLYDIGKKLFPTLDEDYRMKLMMECCNAEQEYLGEHGGNLYPNLETTLEKLHRKYKLFIVSNCQDGYIQCFFKAHKLDKYFDDIECSGVTGLSKGENNKIIIKRNNLKHPIYVGDTNSDLESAKVAEIPFIYARYGFGDVTEYDYVMDKFEDILDIVL